MHTVAYTVGLSTAFQYASRVIDIASTRKSNILFITISNYGRYIILQRQRCINPFTADPAKALHFAILV